MENLKLVDARKKLEELYDEEMYSRNVSSAAISLSLIHI